MAEFSIDASVTGEDAFSKLLAVKSPSLDDLKTLLLLEAAGQSFYVSLAEAAPNDEIKHLMSKNGQEEMGHAHRLKRAIKLVHGEDFEIPSDQDNPLYKAPLAAPVVSKELLQMIAKGEIDGEAFYEGWASHIGNEQAAKLLRQNGKEEANHGARMTEALKLLPN